ncbi:tetratricopeptide repeat protein [Neotamlana laminarinivorans]|uniref:Tetratricopeptide repeat protein n=1 Tax=Neotamlana laminarinivorans TaxID=2883124 RepID=A0A9X1L300_9FLAO|nr:tetratricopeptide repeat protein [Tamlana laminarinivorans]MCB4798149.1 tetratricopeptide repeat protein [Tamlana laminarinivorans]
MKHLLIILSIFISLVSFSQEEDDAMKAQLLAMKKANNYVYEGNALLNDDDFVSAEMEYRKALSEQASTKAGVYNLGTSYIKNGNFDEALYRLQQAASSSTSKEEKHRAFHNIGNLLMKNKKCKEAVEAYKNALRNNPTDDETRYNLGIAKECAEEQQDQQDQNQDQNQDQDKQDENKENEDQQDKQDQENKDKEGENDENQDKKDEGDQEDKKDGEDEKDEDGKPKDEKEDKGDKGDEQKQNQQPKPQPGQLSPQQIKNLLEAMNNQEQKVQEKMNAEKQKGVKVKTEKDW